MREIVHLQAGQCGNQIGAKVRDLIEKKLLYKISWCWISSIRNDINICPCQKQLGCSLIVYSLYCETKKKRFTPEINVSVICSV